MVTYARTWNLECTLSLPVPAQTAGSVPSTPSYQLVPTFQVLANGTAAYQLQPATYQAVLDINQTAKAGYQPAAPLGTQTIPAAFSQQQQQQQQQQTYTAAVALMPPTDPAVFAATKPTPAGSIQMPPAFSNSILQVLRRPALSFLRQSITRCPLSQRIMLRINLPGASQHAEGAVCNSIAAAEAPNKSISSFAPATPTFASFSL